MNWKNRDCVELTRFGIEEEVIEKLTEAGIVTLGQLGKLTVAELASMAMDFEFPTTGYLNIYENRGNAELCPDRKTADEIADADRIACVRIEYREGQFDGSGN